MTTLHDEILGRADCAGLVAAKDLDGLAELVSIDRKEIKSRYVTARTVLSEVAGGGDLLDKLQAIGQSPGGAPVKYAMTFLNQDSGIDIGNVATQAMVDQLMAAGVLSSDEGTALKNLALQPAPVSRTDIEDALFNPDGSLK